jgi:hypothetical protein
MRLSLSVEMLLLLVCVHVERVEARFSLLPYFEKVEYAYEIRLLSVCVSVYPPIGSMQRLGESPLSLIGNGSVEVPLSLLGDGSVRLPLSLPGNGSVKIPLSLLGNGSVKVPLSLLGNGSVETLPR